jgi:uncharacterized integral membrane protein (TIGR00698 family)
MTLAVIMGVLAANLPGISRLTVGPWRKGLDFAGKRLMRAGIVLLGLKLSVVDVLELGWATFAVIVAVVLLAFGGTYLLGKAFRLPGDQPLLIATGFSICGASAIGAMSGVVKARDKETATPVALVTLCGTLAIAVLPALWHPLGLSAQEFGHWVGASVHDVGQVVATAQIAGTTALAVAVVIKLTRVLMLAPMVSLAAVVVRSRSAADAPSAKRPPIMPLFVAGFLAAVVIRTLVDLPEPVLASADLVQTALLAMALFGLGTAVRLRELVRTGWRALVVGLLSWLLIAVLALGAVAIS